jgi:hypothetical protein
MVTVRKALADDFEAVCPLLLEFRNPYIPKEQWRQLFVDHWNSNEGYFGYVMLDGGKTVGFLGLIFSKRNIRGREHRFCNLTSWIVREPYRGRSLFMFLPLLKEPDTTLIDLTPSAEVYALLKKAGFQDFETRRRVLFPFPGSGPHCALISDPAALKTSLDPESLKIYRDHPFPGCRHVLIESEFGHCYVVLTRLVRMKKPLLLAVVQYLSDRDVFLKCVNRAVPKLCLRLKVTCLFIDERFLEGRTIPFSVSRNLDRPRLFKSNTLRAMDLDALYSEFPVLNI